LKRDVVELGSLDPVRDLVFVGDTVAGFLALADAPSRVGLVTNLATGVAVSVGELATRILRLVGRDIPLRTTEARQRPVASEVFRLLGNADAARATGWSPRTNLDDGLQHTIAWMRPRLDRYRVEEYRV
jgi:dTDP-glucose 4,6-dehydratase